MNNHSVEKILSNLQAENIRLRQEDNQTWALIDSRFCHWLCQQQKNSSLDIQKGYPLEEKVFLLEDRLQLLEAEVAELKQKLPNKVTEKEDFVNHPSLDTPSTKSKTSRKLAPLLLDAKDSLDNISADQARDLIKKTYQAMVEEDLGFEEQSIPALRELLGLDRILVDHVLWQMAREGVIELLSADWDFVFNRGHAEEVLSLQKEDGSWEWFYFIRISNE